MHRHEFSKQILDRKFDFVNRNISLEHENSVIHLDFKSELLFFILILFTFSKDDNGQKTLFKQFWNRKCGISAGNCHFFSWLLKINLTDWRRIYESLQKTLNEYKIDYFMSENINTQFHSCWVTVSCFGSAVLLLLILFQEKLDYSIYRISLTRCRKPNIDIWRSQQEAHFCIN